MKVLQTIGGFGAKGGGTSTCTYDLLTAIHNVDAKNVVDLLTPEVKSDNDRMMGNGESWIKTVKNDYKTPLAISANLKHYLRDSNYDIYHTNGMWMHINHITCSIARQRKKPYVITPHGMLYPEALARSLWKKWPIRKLWFDKDIREASCIHATCEDEMMHLRALGYDGPVALIGNPVGVPDYTAELISSRISNSKKKLGFLGRLHSRKKVEQILYAVALRPNANLEVVIIGTGDDNYEQFLRNEVSRLGISEKVTFAGFLNGRAKFEQLAELDALFVPSDMENFGMIIPEALIVGTPVMASLGTPWKVLNNELCGWWCDNFPETIAKVIDKLYSLSPQELCAMGQRGREYIMNTFSADKVAGQMLELYKWLNCEIDKPGFVHTL